MKIGVTIGDVRGPATADELVSQAGNALDAGLNTAWCAQAFGWDALVALTLVGTRVPTIELGSAVVPIPQRHPLVLASQALSVQAALGGRFTLGIGVGVALMVEGMFGLPADRQAVRMSEYLSVLVPLLHGENVEHQGETLTAVGGVAVPGTNPPAVLVAALGPSMLRLAGQLAEGVVTWMTGPKTLASHIVPRVTNAAATAGRPAPRIVAGLPVSVTDDAEAVRARIGDQLGLAGQVPEYRAILDREGVEGPQDVAIVGDEQAIAESIRQIADTGVTDFMASPFGTTEEQDRTVQFLAQFAT
jgi:F420-dependent oxidoreductase-like protein